jgi:hypothetical protein
MTATMHYTDVHVPINDSFWDKTKGFGTKVAEPIVDVFKSAVNKVNRFGSRHQQLTDFMKGSAIMFFWTFATVFITVFAVIMALVTFDFIAVALGL